MGGRGEELWGGELAIRKKAAGVEPGGGCFGFGFEPDDDGRTVGKQHGFEAAYGITEVDLRWRGEGRSGVDGVAGIDTGSVFGGGEPGDGECGAAGIGGGAIDGATGDFPVVVTEGGGRGPGGGGEVEDGGFVVADFVRGVAAVGDEDTVAGKDSDGVLAAAADVRVDGPVAEARAVGGKEAGH